ncbi:hypothetical protein IFM89_005249 [Coptis chinensis]|uniref:Pentatricopeptide repeat-containing protein n=1 Tax=Coptis chinensis TaxID=261450 RepID=A0A835IW36_9MAGN|nr:hypothetical protein IFM89_005249 [Coptis chinensis]
METIRMKNQLYQMAERNKLILSSTLELKRPSRWRKQKKKNTLKCSSLNMILLLLLHPVTLAPLKLLLFVFQADALLDVYAKMGDFNNAERLFDEMGVRDIATWNALISGLAQGSRARDALELFKRMGFQGLKRNEVTVLGAPSACSHLGALGEGEAVYSFVKENGLDGNVQVCNAVIDMYAKCGLVEKARNVFNSMNCSKSLVSWNAMIMGFAMHGHGVDALELFNEMGRVGVVPDGITYLAALCACNHAGLVYLDPWWILG